MTTRLHDGDIAIIGMSGRFPGAKNIDEFWSLLSQGREGIARLSEQDLLDAGIPRDIFGRDDYVRAAGIVDDVDRFDAEFFGFTPRQAAELDPQQRHFLECAWEALEDAACNPARHDGAIGVFASAGAGRYGTAELAHALNSHNIIDLIQHGLNVDKDFLATKASYKFDLRGPSLSIQTACSSSLVAIHLACQSIRQGDCDVALAGGANIHIPHGGGYIYTDGGILSNDGHCRAFDVAATGTVPGSGVAVLVLKRLSAAIAARNHVYAVVRNTAINNDGAFKLGYTAPSIEGQVRVLKAAMRDIDPATIGMLEAHGTGTGLGDLAEITALNDVFGERSAAASPRCALGSVKSNVGHLDAAAGACGVIKAALCLHNKQLVPTLHVETPNPLLQTEGSAFYLNTRLRDWSASDVPLRAAVSSFGMGGTNAHAVLEEAPPAYRMDRDSEASKSSSAPTMIVLSARSPAALAEQRRRLAAFLGDHPTVPLDDVAYTMLFGRKRFEHRQHVAGMDRAALIADLATPGSAAVEDAAQSLDVMFFFHWDESLSAERIAAMGWTDALWRDEFDACAQVIRDCTGFDAGVWLQTRSEAQRTRSGDVWMQFVAHYCSARMLLVCGIAPSLFVGGGIGEISALCAAQALTLHDCARLLHIVLSSDAGRQEALERSLAATSFNEHHDAVVSVRDMTQLGQQRIADPGFWIEAVGESVRHPESHDLASSLLDEDAQVVVHCTLSGLNRLGACGSVQHDGASPRPLSGVVLARLWERGAQFDMQTYADRFSCGFVRLPTYPFQKTRFWTPGERQAAVAARIGGENKVRGEDGALAFYVPAWRPSRTPSGTGGAADAHRSWIVIDNAAEIGIRLADRLQGLGADVFLAGSEPAASGAGIGCENQSVAAWLRDLLGGLAQRRASINHIVFCAPQDNGDMKATPSQACAAAAAHYAFVLALVRQYDSIMVDVPLTLTLVTSRLSDDLQQVRQIGADLLTSLPAILRREAPHVSTVAIDVPLFDVGGGLRSASAYLDWITAETLHGMGESDVAYRSGRRLVRHFAEHADAISCQVPDLMREKGVYMITGGLGAIGFALAGRLARQYRARIVLVSRTDFPGREVWEGLLADPAQAGSAQARHVAAIRDMERDGAAIEVLCADVGSPEQVTHVVELAERRFGRINGVFHLAAALNAGSAHLPIGACGSAQLVEQATPKLGGMLSLERAFERRTLDFCVVFSSTASLLGGVGFAAYTMANAACDAAAQSGRHCGQVPWLALNWDGWHANGDSRDSRAGAHAISFDSGFDALFASLTFGDLPQLVVAKAGFNERYREAARGRMPTPVTAVDSTDDVTPDNPQAAATATEETSEVEAYVIQLWAKHLGIAAIKLDDDFFRLGGDSLVLLAISSEIKDEFYIDIPLRELLEFDMTVRGFAEALVASISKSTK